MANPLLNTALKPGAMPHNRKEAARLIELKEI